MEVIIYYILCLFARKKLFLNVSYFVGTIVFISLSYRSANELLKIPRGQQQQQFASSSEYVINISQISNESFLYEERVEYLKNKCYDKNHPSSSTIPHISHRSLLKNHLGFHLQSQSLFYCSVPKVATRTLLTYITYLHVRDELIPSLTNNSSIYFKGITNLFDMNYLYKMFSDSVKNESLLLLTHFLSAIKSNSSNVDLWAMYQKHALPYIRLRSLVDHSILFKKSYHRVIFVRHPLERLASAYVDKIASLKAEPFTLYDSLRRDMCRKYSSAYLSVEDQNAYRTNRLLEKQKNEPCEKVIPIFEHFVNYTLSGTAQVDVHWYPYSNLCDVCKMKYNFIGKYETIQDDLNYLKYKLDLNFTDWNVDNHFSTGKTKENYRLMYSKLPDNLICNLKNFYSEDAKLFDYRLEDYLTDNQQKINCPSRYYRRYQAISH